MRADRGAHAFLRVVAFRHPVVLFFDLSDAGSGPASDRIDHGDSAVADPAKQYLDGLPLQGEEFIGDVFELLPVNLQIDLTARRHLFFPPLASVEINFIFRDAREAFGRLLGVPALLGCHPQQVFSVASGFEVPGNRTPLQEFINVFFDSRYAGILRLARQPGVVLSLDFR